MKNLNFEKILTRCSLFISAALTLSACSSTPSAAPHPESSGKTAIDAKTIVSGTPSTHPDGDLLNATVNTYAEASKRLDPYYATIFNVEEDLSKFGDYPSPAYLQRSRMLYQTALAALKNVHPENLSNSDLQLYSLFKEDMEVSLNRMAFPTELLEFNQMDNRMHAYIDDSSQALTNFPFDSVAHYDAFVERANGFPTYVDNQIALFRRGIKEKITLSCAVVEKTAGTFQDGKIVEVEKNPFFRPILFMPATIPQPDKERLSKNFKKVITEKIQPAYVKFDTFFRTEYLPHCRNGFGIGDLPNSKAWYAAEIQSKTNLTLSPKTIHELGLKEVERISHDMNEIKNKVGFKGTLAEFLKSLTHDSKYFFTSAADMFKAFKDVKVKVALKIPQYFDLIPKSDYEIVETSNPEDAAGSYNAPTENVPHGRFIVNTKNLRSVATYGITTLSLHETIPGHHFQLALQFEMKDQLSEYQRKVFQSNSFVEGWALYSEFLGNEMGMYEDPMQRLGNRNDEMLRAVRLVVDTGIHAYGWSRVKAQTYMSAHLASDQGDIDNEVNRYSVWPGQALGYKLGQLKIIELRRKAEKAMGPKFNIKDFHRVVIGGGTISLGLLETKVNEWIKAASAVNNQ